MLWLLTMMAQVFAKGFRADILRRFLCFALFWHALDIIWVAVFTVVYLLGAQHERRRICTIKPTSRPATKSTAASGCGCSAISSVSASRSC